MLVGGAAKWLAKEREREREGVLREEKTMWEKVEEKVAVDAPQSPVNDITRFWRKPDVFRNPNREQIGLSTPSITSQTSIGTDL